MSITERKRRAEQRAAARRGSGRRDLPGPSRALALLTLLALAPAGCELVAGTKDRKVGTVVSTGSGGSSAGGTVGLDAGSGTGGTIGTDGPPAAGDSPIGGVDLGSDTAQGAGGTPATGGMTGTGGVAGTGGVPATGGSIAVDGGPDVPADAPVASNDALGTQDLAGTGGLVTTGGAVGAGGAISTGGVIGAGGTPGTGGTPGAGGTPGTGGTPGAGGVATGGTGAGGAIAIDGGSTATGGAAGGANGCPTHYRYARFVALTAVNANDPLTSMSEFELLDAQGNSLPRSGWRLSTDSQELVDAYNPVDDVMDGDTSTIWQTEWGTYIAPLPHNLTIDLVDPQVVSGFVYTPRQDWYNGRVAQWAFYLSNDPSNWGNAVVRGNFPDGTDVQRRTFTPDCANTGGAAGAGGSGGSPTGHRYARLLAITSIPNDSLTSVSEFELLDAQGNSLPRAAWGLSTDSQELANSNTPVYAAIDGDPATCWLTEWGDYVAPLPHNLTIDLGARVVVSGFIYTPRQDWYNGRIGQWEFYLSDDPNNWGSPVTSGYFPDTVKVQKRTFTPQ